MPSPVYLTENVTQNVTQYVTQNVTQNVTQYVTQNVTQNVTQYIAQSFTQIVPSFASIHITEWITVERTIVNNITQVNTVTSVNSITIQEIERAAEEIRKNLTVDAKTTSSYIRSKTSAHDPRESVKYMGLLGTLLVVVPMTVILLMDVKRIVTDIRSYEHIFKKD